MKVKLNEKSLASIVVPDDVVQLVVWDSEVTGFGVVIGKQNRTFIAEARVNGRKRRKAIGVAGRVRGDGFEWTVQLARAEAKKLIGDMAHGVDPNSERRLRREGPTLRDALELHVGKMRRDGSRPRSIEVVKHETEKHLDDWLDVKTAVSHREAGIWRRTARARRIEVEGMLCPDDHEPRRRLAVARGGYGL